MPWQRIETKWPNIARAAERVVLHVEVGHPGGGDRPGDADALEVRVHRDREAELVRRLPDRVVDGVAVRDARGAGEEDADELVASAEPADLAAAASGYCGGTTIIPRRRGSGSSQRSSSQSL